jgi:peroxiredoxin
MSKSTVWVLAGVVLVVGLVVGFAVAALVMPGDAARVRNAELQVGDEAPDFRLPDHTGGYVRLSDLEGEKNIVIAFYPLAWTPV